MADPIAQLCELIAGKLRDESTASQDALVAFVEEAIAKYPELEAALKADQRMLQINRDGSSGFQTLVQGGVANIGIHYHLTELEKFEAVFAAVLQKLQTPVAKVINFEPYVRSLIAHKQYQQKWGFYTPTDAVGKIQQPQAASELDIGLMVQLMQPKKAEGDCPPGPQVQTEQLPVLEGIRKYAAEHVLLEGRPGSGKSTALLRLLLDEANQTLADPSGRIPVLVELRYLDAERPTVLERVEAFLRSHDLAVEEAILKQALTEGRLLLLMDGVNELPSEAARRAVARFRQDYPKTPMVFTTRDVALGGDLGIEKKLEMQPLSETQMRQFVQTYLPEQGEPMLRQLQGRLREVGQTPLLLWMLCQVFQGLQQIPSSLGLLFRWFAGEYDKLKRDVPVSEGLRHWQAELLQYLAFAMMQAEEPTELRVAISRREAETVLAEFLQGKVDYPNQRAKEWLEDLLEHHLIQPTSQDRLEFHHQLLQEYYAAEHLLKLLPDLTDEQLKQDYLNYLKWTEPVALMLALVDEEAQALWVVKLAMHEVDLMLGARFAGEVKIEFQEKTVGLFVGQDYLPSSTISHLLGLTRSEKAIPYLENQITLANSSTCTKAIKALGKISTEIAVDTLIKHLNCFENNEFICGEIALALGEIRSPSAVSFLEDWNRIEASKGNEPSYLKIRIEIALWEVYGDSRKPIIFQKIIPDYSEQDFEREQGEINLDNVIKFMESEVIYYNNSESFIKTSLAKFKDEDVIPRLANIVSTGWDNAKKLALEILCDKERKETKAIFIKALSDKDPYVIQAAVSGLANIGNETLIPILMSLLCHENRNVRDETIRAFGKIGGDISFKTLTELFKENQFEYYDTGKLAKALGKIGREESIDLLISRLDKENYSLNNNIVEAIGSIGGDKAIKTLIRLLNNKQLDISDKVAKTLTDAVESDRNLPILAQQLSHLFTLISTEISEEALSIITAIQSRCKYYNHELWQAAIET